MPSPLGSGGKEKGQGAGKVYLVTFGNDKSAPLYFKTWKTPKIKTTDLGFTGPE